MEFRDFLMALVSYNLEGRALGMFWHDTAFYLFPSGTDTTIQWAPQKGHVYYVFGVTFGKPRDYVTSAQITSDDYGFYHWHKQMQQHWDPAVESIYDVEYPHWLEVSTKDPMFLQFVNNYTNPVIQDVSVWMIDVHEEDAPVVRRLLQGYFNQLYYWGGFTREEMDKMVEQRRSPLPLL